MPRQQERANTKALRGRAGRMKGGGGFFFRGE